MTKGNPNLALYWSFSWHILAFSSADNWSKWACACSAWLSWVSCPAWANRPARSGWTRRIPSLTKCTKRCFQKMLFYSTDGWGIPDNGRLWTISFNFLSKSSKDWKGRYFHKAPARTGQCSTTLPVRLMKSSKFKAFNSEIVNMFLLWKRV